MSISSRATLALALCFGVLAGCSSSPETNAPETNAGAAPEVASLRSAPAAASSAPAAGRPVIRVDMTREEEMRLTNGWYQCLKEQGVPMKQGADGNYEFAGADGKIKIEDPKIQKACQSTMPLPPPELDEAQNPYFQDDNNNYWQCLKDHGDDVHRVADGWEPGPKWGQFPNAAAVTEACEVEAFDGKKG